MVLICLEGSLPINVQLTRSFDAYMGRPGNKWKVELTRKKISSIRVTDGSGANPGMIGLIVVMMAASSVIQKLGKKQKQGQLTPSIKLGMKST